ncbi:MAG: family 2 glycosyl transferase [Phycisphaerae bacterium]|nr:family 2 glycosyl transferase [Phycisphaerae bacterium]
MSTHQDKSSPQVSIVCPMHNEQECVTEYVRRTAEAMKLTGRTHEIIIVSDGSTDRTEEILQELSLDHPELTTIVLDRNMGQCTAIYAGIQSSSGRYVVIMDGDLQHLPEEIHLLLDEMDDGYSLVSGTRTSRSESFFLRRIPSRIANWMLRTVTGCSIRDMGGFKCIRGDLARSFRLHAGQHRLLPALVWMRGGSVSEVPVSAPARFAGTSHYGLSRSLDVFFDILLLWFQASFKSRPLYMFGRIGLILILIDCVIMPWLLIEKFVYDVPMGTRPPFLIAIMLFLSALFIFTAGFMLELISDTRSASAGIRPYVVRRTISMGTGSEHMAPRERVVNEQAKVESAGTG